MITSMATDLNANFFNDVQSIAELHEEMRNKFQLKQLRNVEQIVKDNSDLFVAHWKSVLCMTGLSHDFIITHLCLREIVARLDESEIEEVFKFLINLDRVIEIDLSQQIASLASTRSDVRLNAQIDFMRATRSVIRNFIENDLHISPLNKSNVPCHIGSY